MIITNDEKALRVFCEPVLLEEVDYLIRNLESELDNSNRLGVPGIGLAASQIGIAKHIAIIRLGNGSDLNLVNCKIEKTYDPFIFKEEGCLSYPGRIEDTIRFQEVHVVNNLVYPHNFIATDLMAVAIQHELDHLNSILFMDHKVPAPKVLQKIGDNERCPCKSGKKFKKCCKGKI